MTACTTRLPRLPAGHRRLELKALLGHLAVLETRTAELADLMPNYFAAKSDQRQRLRWLRQEKTRTAKLIRQVKRAIAAAQRGPT